ncbi:MAG: DUF1456 family protein [Pseudomonadota bacterium]
MTHNDVLRRIRYIFDLDDNNMIEVFACADHAVTREQVCAWLKQEADPGYQALDDRQMAIFLNGWINARRGRRDGPQPIPEDSLTNNMVLMKLRIALNLQSEDVLALLEETGLTFSKHELTALFRKPGHKHYRRCEDQVLRNFLKGLQLRVRGEAQASSEPEPQSQVEVSPQTHDVWKRS